MVDINLIGDDKTGEEERVEDFSQTSSMDTQELAFEERTETFDTTKTAGFAPKRSYSPLLTTLIIMVVIVLLGGAIYYFMFNGDGGSRQAENPALEQQSEAPQAVDNQDIDLDQLSQEFAQDLSDFGEQAQQPEAGAAELPAETEPAPVATRKTEVKAAPPASAPPVSRRPAPRRVRTGSTPRFIADSRGSIQAVTSLLTSMPDDINTTLLSSTGQRLRMEYVARTAGQAKDFANRLSDYVGAGNYKVVSETQVASSVGALEKVLVSGTRPNDGSGSSGESMRFLNVGQASDWFRSTARQLGLTVRALSPMQGTFSGGYQRTPILVKLYGSQSSIVSFLQELSSQSINMELTKILLVSPDVSTFSDDNMILVLTALLYEQG